MSEDSKIGPTLSHNSQAGQGRLQLSLHMYHQSELRHRLIGMNALQTQWECDDRLTIPVQRPLRIVTEDSKEASCVRFLQSMLVKYGYIATAEPTLGLTALHMRVSRELGIPLFNRWDSLTPEQRIKAEKIKAQMTQEEQEARKRLVERQHNRRIKRIERKVQKPAVEVKPVVVQKPAVEVKPVTVKKENRFDHYAVPKGWKNPKPEPAPVIEVNPDGDGVIIRVNKGRVFSLFLTEAREWENYLKSRSHLKDKQSSYEMALDGFLAHFRSGINCGLPTDRWLLCVRPIQNVCCWIQAEVPVTESDVHVVGWAYTPTYEEAKTLIKASGSPHADYWLSRYRTPKETGARLTT